ncbi:glycogen debranching protein [Lachnoclostridium sp. Marseille-P6806]|uniref:glycogen debranching protein n=1 Tax=Lachnoclostridium sp. Marseille-P6806 TaxID=2364793 RepID=UPI00102FA76D|nr:alpha-amylase family glycosyl hydrolase [Lachnoclostridium sp. Marseille-P6806]
MQQEFAPTEKIGDYWVRPGLYDISGAMPIPGGANFTMHSNGAAAAELCLFHRKAAEPFAVIPFPVHFRIGYTYAMMVFGIDIEEIEYCYRLDGPWNPAEGLLFDKRNNLLDPYAMAVVGQSAWGKRRNGPGDYRGRVVNNTYDWKASRFPLISMQDSVIYELHVRGFTVDPSSGVQYPGTFAGLIEKIPHLRELGVTAVELMPIMEFDETMNSREYGGRKLLEYWGYNTVSFFAPNTSYAASHEYNYEGLELKNMVRILHENGIEVIMDVVFNHTAEGNEQGPIINFKGFGNNISYMLDRDGRYYNFSGCGNTFNCNHPLIQKYIMECLRYWVTEYRIDGFRFDLASIMGRNRDGSPMENPPLLENLADDSILGKTKLIAEAWDAGGLYQVGKFPAYKRWAEWNGSYRDCLRDYLKGNYWNARETADRIIGSPDLYHGVYEGYTSSVNFLTCHDGFTLRDLYSYNEKHNEANGWGNTDGANDNRSWNCGAEGETDDPAVNALRRKMMCNAITVLMCSRGTPMILAGDEFCNTQFGNNNSYCQDNEISWLNWRQKDENRTYFEFYRNMIAFRKKHPCISRTLLEAACGLPPVMTCGIDAEHPYVDENTSTLCVLFSGRQHEDAPDDGVFLVINSYWEPCEVILPALPGGYHWQMEVNTGGDDGARFFARPLSFEGRVTALAEPRSVLVFSLYQGW